MTKEYKQCANCVLDTVDDPAITFDSKGVCSYCNSYYENYEKNPMPSERKNAILNDMIAKIKRDGKGKKYDSIIGLSGGVDSSYLAMKAKEFGLNSLLVHFDNGWNSELAVKNIELITNYTGYDLYTYVVDWEEYKALQLAYIKSGVIDWEIPTDHGFYACLYKTAFKFKITNILAGFNHQTEAILPTRWVWKKNDLYNIHDIYKKHGGGRKLKSFPQLGFFKKLYIDKFNKTTVFSPLEYLDYNANLAKQEIISKMGWRDYGGKHHESIFTRFYQGYVLPLKFNVDKRKAHLSNLICSGIITREEALNELKKSPYDEALRTEDLNFFLKKMGISQDEFDSLMKAKEVPHLNFRSYEVSLFPAYFKTIRIIKKILFLK